MGASAWGILAEIQSIENSLDSRRVKAVSILSLLIDRGDKAIQQGEALPHILNVDSVFFRCSVRQSAALKAELYGRHVVHGGAGSQREDEHQKENGW